MVETIFTTKEVYIITIFQRVQKNFNKNELIIKYLLMKTAPRKNQTTKFQLPAFLQHSVLLLSV